MQVKAVLVHEKQPLSLVWYFSSVGSFQSFNIAVVVAQEAGIDSSPSTNIPDFEIGNEPSTSKLEFAWSIWVVFPHNKVRKCENLFLLIEVRL